MARMADARRMYGGDKVTTTPERLITMLYDRMVRDLVAAEQAIERGDREASHRELTHAQEIVVELLAALDVDKWSGAAQLRQLYAWVLQQLFHANVEQDVELVQHCRKMIEPLAEAWHVAAAQVTRGAIQRNLQPTTILGAAV